ncbi:hypothetical protein AJ87_25940 [Rhizobium yanglingense]|nr:hypothetical protein AJ87_25940 [Rhizobium yanglingense]
MADDIDNMRADFRLGNWNKCLGVAGWVSGAPALVPAPFCVLFLHASRAYAFLHKTEHHLLRAPEARDTERSSVTRQNI